MEPFGSHSLARFCSNRISFSFQCALSLLVLERSGKIPRAPPISSPARAPPDHTPGDHFHLEPVRHSLDLCRSRTNFPSACSSHSPRSTRTSNRLVGSRSNGSLSPTSSSLRCNICHSTPGLSLRSLDNARAFFLYICSFAGKTFPARLVGVDEEHFPAEAEIPRRPEISARRVVEPENELESIDPVLEKISKSGIGSLTAGGNAAPSIARAHAS